MENLNKQYPPLFKVKVALEALKEIKTSSELASEFQVHPTQIRTWKAAAKKGLVEVFADREDLIQELYRQISQLKVDLGLAQKNLAFSHKEKLLLLDKEHSEISLRHQAEFLGISR